MKQFLCPVLENRPLWSDWQLLTFDAPDPSTSSGQALARSIRIGQFALARDPSTLDPYLRRTLWLYEIRDSRVSFILNTPDPLAQHARQGDTLDLLAPLGHALTFEPSAKHILLLGQGSRIMPLIAMAHEAVKQEKEVVLISKSDGRTPLPADERHRDAAVNFPVQLLAPEIELRNDESFDAELIAWADAIVASGGADFYRELSVAIRAVRMRVPPEFARVWLNVPMPCGTGICYACAVDTSRGIRLVCVDGPALDLLQWEKRT